VAKKWVDLDPYFAKKIADDKLYTEIPKEVWVEKLLAEKEKSYHVWGKVLSGETIHDFWLPKGALLKTHKTEKVEIDYSKYDHRPPLTHQKEAIEKLAGSKRFILADDMGLGKAEFVENKVFTPYGRKRIGDLKIGDEVIGSNGKKCFIKGVYPQGIKDLYRVTFNDGVSVLVCKEHLFSVKSRSFGDNTKNSRNKESIVLSVEQMLDNDLFLEINGSKNNLNRKYKFKTYYKETGGHNKWQIPIVKPIEFISNELPLNPYLLGLILGDGGITQNSISFTTEDVEIVETIKSILPENSQIVKNGSSKYGYKLTKKTGHTNPIIQTLKDLKLREQAATSVGMTMLTGNSTVNVEAAVTVHVIVDYHNKRYENQFEVTASDYNESQMMAYGTYNYTVNQTNPTQQKSKLLESSLNKSIIQFENFLRSIMLIDKEGKQ
jgi:hypothetical protein